MTCLTHHVCSESGFQYLRLIAIQNESFRRWKVQKKYWLGVRIYRGSVDIRNGHKRKFGKNGLVWAIIYVQNADFKILDWFPFKMKPLEGRKSRKKYWLGFRIYRGSVDLRNRRKREFVKMVLFHPSYTFRMRI